MSTSAQLIHDVQRDADRADELQRESRDLLLDAVHRAAEAGLTQREIAAAVRRSQPEVSRLLRVKRPGRLGQRVRSQRQRVLDIAREFGADDVRLFGSVADGSETAGSDIDLLVSSTDVLSLGTLSRMERALSDLLDAEVDVVPVRSLPPHAKSKVLAQAVRL